MTDLNIIKAARRLQSGKDLLALANYWQEEQTDVVLSTSPTDGSTIYEALMRFHAVGEFVEFVNQLAQETDQNG